MRRLEVAFTVLLLACAVEVGSSFFVSYGDFYIDPVLDEMRNITAKLKPDVSLTPEDKNHLLEVYRRIEEYLMKNDPLRSSGLRNRLCL